MTQALPVLDVIDQIRSALDEPGACVLIVPPGTGKTTGIPPELLGEPWLADNRVLVLEPRRLAARVGASRMAATHNEAIGKTFGYSVRGESRTSATTRVEVVTEGLFLRRLQRDPALTGVGAVILDEFHERSVDSDLALALLIDVRGSLRPDLRIMVMSATLEPGAVAALLNAPIVTATATIFPVETRYRPGSIHDPLEGRVVDVISEALRTDTGDVLVFLPGRPEINRTRRAMERRIGAGRRGAGGGGAGGGGGGDQHSGGDLQIVELHGSLSPAEQQMAIEPDPQGRRKVVLSTSLAETSITVPGVRSVVDSGRRRTTSFDPHTGLPGLTTVPVSRSGADQRRGRAGRTAPGVAYRLWSGEEHRHRPESDQPEILDAELSSLLLQLRAWGVDDPSTLEWLDSPPSPAVDRARELLKLLAAIDGEGRMTTLGREFAEIGFHPRLAAMATAGSRLGCPELAAEVCALVETSRSGEIDLVERIEALRSDSDGRPGGDLGHSLRQWRSTLKSIPGRSRRGSGGRVGSERGRSGSKPSTDEATAQLVMAGYPDRLARRRDSKRTTDSGHIHTVFQLRTGGEITVPEHHPFEQTKWLVAADLDHRSGRLHLGVALGEDQVMGRFESEIVTEDVVEWNDRGSTIDAKQQSFLGTIKVAEQPLAHPSAQALRSALDDALRQRGVSLLGRLGQADEFRSRVMLVREVSSNGDEWPDLSDSGLADDLLDWLGDRVSRIKSIEGFNRIDVLAVLREQLRWDQSKALDDLVPTGWKLASGRSVRLRYGEVDGDPSTVLASVRLRDAFGTDVHPTVMAGAVPVTVQLLSPAGRPVQRTTDLPGFWRGSYRDVRSDLRGRYPKHPWPEEPWKRPTRKP